MANVRLGTVFGLEIRIDYSWFVLLFLIFWTFAIGVFPAAHPDLPTRTHLAMGAAGTLLFFASLLAHELSHSLVARARGVPMEGITLFIFGGVAHARAEFDDPRDEIAIAGAGPLASFVIAGLFTLVDRAGATLGWSAAVTGVAGYLASLNLILAVFNLAPGFPLDGGRLLRAFVWMRTGDLTRATRTASRGGVVVGYLLIGLGMLEVFAGSLIGGLWLALIGWFLRTTAEAGYLQHLLQGSLRDVAVERAMQPLSEGIPPDLTLQRLVDEYLLWSLADELPVATADRTIGFVTLDQVKAVPRSEWPHRTVAEVMTPVEGQSVVRPEEAMPRVLEALRQPRTRRVLVASNGRIEGVITATDVARLLSRIRALHGS